MPNIGKSSTGIGFENPFPRFTPGSIMGQRCDRASRAADHSKKLPWLTNHFTRRCRREVLLRCCGSSPPLVVRARKPLSTSVAVTKSTSSITPIALAVVISYETHYWTKRKSEMSSLPPQDVPTHDELIERAVKLQPALRAYAAEADRDRAVSAEVIDAMTPNGSR